MPSDEMVEKVARAICRAYARRTWPHAAPDVIDNWVNQSCRSFFDEAEAALAAAEAGEPVAWGVHRMTVEPQEDGTWLATCPDLPGCIATADTPDVALSRLRDVQASWLAVCHERGIKVPEPATAIRARGEA
jgi:predicted RNase H-like HicB family nuclease